MRLKISNRNSNLARIASKLGEPTALTQAGAMFLLALAHESAKAKAFEPLSDVQILLAKSKSLSARLDSGAGEQPDEQALALQAGFDDLLSAWDATQTSQLSGDIDQAYEALTQISQAEPLAVLAQNTWRAPVSDAAVDYVDPGFAAPLKPSPEVPQEALEPMVQAGVATEDALVLKMEPELPLDPNALGATSAGFIFPLPAVLGAIGGGAALAGGAGSGGGAGPGSTVTTNNMAVITSELGKDTGSVSTSTLNAMGKFNVQDADPGESEMKTQTDVAGTYGTFNVSSDGKWTYVLNPTLNAFKALPKDGLGVDSFTVKSLDGSAQQMVKVNVTGINDAPVITSSPQYGVVQEDVTVSVSGRVVASDVDSTAVLTYAGPSAGVYGAFLVKSNGEWIYTLNNSAVQSFSETTLVTERFTVVASDEFGLSASQQVLVDIKGTNDTPQISVSYKDNISKISELPNVSGSTVVRELSGKITFTDVDAFSNLSTYTVSNTTAANTNYPGTFTLGSPNTAGEVNWTYRIEDRHLDQLEGPPTQGAQPELKYIHNTLTINDGSNTTNAIAVGDVLVTLLGTDAL